MKYAVIGGTGFEKPFEETSEVIVNTPYGKSSIIVPKDKNYYFLSRHGEKHSLAPHKINYRANIWALHELGVEFIYAICAVGSIKKDFKPGSILLLKDFLDFTKSRTQTFFDGDILPLKHLEMSNPYSLSLNEAFEKEFNEKLNKGIYVATEGPRFETATEISFYRSIGGDVVGMTNVPEVILARELELEYSAICYVTNYCTGLVEYVNESDIAIAKETNRKKILSSIDHVFSKEADLYKRQYPNFC